MPGIVADPPSVSLSFANNFWGKDDAGVTPLLDRMHAAKVTSDELKSFYSARAALEEEYSRKLLNLSRKPLGSLEGGTLRLSLDVVRGEVESIGKAHQNIAQQMRTELEEQLAAFAGGMKERRKIVQTGTEKLLRVKTQQTNTLNKSRDKFEQDCLKIKGYLAQGHMVMGQEERKNKAKLEKTQIQLSTTQTEYEQTVKVVEETTGRWNREWKAACDKFQDLEEERIDFMKNSLWSFANIASTVCVSDDASCEKIRLSLEDCEVEKDIATFIKESGTGQEIPDPPKFINFCRGDINDNASDVSGDDNYSVAQFQRTMNPAYRSSSPQPSTLESHHDPNSDLAQEMGMGGAGRSQPNSQDNTPRKPIRQSTQPDDGQFRTSNSSQRGLMQVPNADELPEVPHNEYPTDGMTQFCRVNAPTASDGSSVASNVRPSSRDSHSEYSNSASFTSPEPSLGAPSPTKGLGTSDLSQRSGPEPDKKKTSFFQNRSPFRRKSKSEKDRPESFQLPPSNRNTWAPSNTNTTRPGLPFGRNQGNDRISPSPEPADPRASFQLNVGKNVFDVASPDAQRKQPLRQQAGEQDEMARALAAVKDLTKQSSVRMSADRYAGMSTPAPGSATGSSTSQPTRARPSHIPDRTRNQPDQAAPPPSYQTQPQQPPMSRLGAPRPAHTSRQMQQTTQRYTEQNRNLFSSAPAQPRAATRGGVPPGPDRATSPLPFRSTSPRPTSRGNSHPHGASQGNLPRAASPNPYLNGGANANPANRPRAQSTSPVKPRTSGQYGMGRPQSQYDVTANQIPRARSPQPQFNAPRSGDEMAIQLAPGPGDNGYGPPAHYPPRGGSGGRPVSTYDGMAPPGSMPDPRGRSKSFGANGGGPGGGQQLSSDGRPIWHYSRAMHKYQAAIPVELSFEKGDILAVIQHQDDGWWEAEVCGKRGRPGLVPSNYLQNC